MKVVTIEERKAQVLDNLKYAGKISIEVILQLFGIKDGLGILDELCTENKITIKDFKFIYKK